MIQFRFITDSRFHLAMPVAFFVLATLCSVFVFPGNAVAFVQDAPSQQAMDLSIPASDDSIPGAGPVRRYDWFQKLWTSRRGDWAKSVQTDQGAIVFLGDSITQGWGDQMKGAFGDLKVANRGISGDTTRGMLYRIKEDVLDVNPRGVVLLMGTNDLEEKATPEVIADNFKLILAALKKHDADMPIVACQVFPSSATMRRPAEKIKKINELYAAAVKGDSQITLVDTYSIFANANGDAKKEEFPDLLHPNDSGYTKWASALNPVFEQLGWTESTFEIEPGFELIFNEKEKGVSRYSLLSVRQCIPGHTLLKAWVAIRFYSSYIPNIINFS